MSTSTPDSRLFPSSYSVGTPWRTIEDGILDILNGERMSKQRYSELYSIVYNVCSFTRLDQNYDRIPNHGDRNRLTSPNDHGHAQCSNLHHLLKDTLQIFLQYFIQDNGSTKHFIPIYAHAWDKFKFSAKVINAVFLYMNRANEAGACFGRTTPIRIGQVCLQVWKHAVFDVSFDRIYKEVWEIIHEERINGERGRGGSDLNLIIRSYIELAEIELQTYSFTPKNFDEQSLIIYRQKFEEQYLEDLQKFYEAERLAFNNQPCISVSDYIKKVLSWFDDEDSRTQRYLHSSSFAKVTEVLEDTLIVDSFDTLAQEYNRLISMKIKEIGNLEFENHIKELKSIYSLLFRIKRKNVELESQFQKLVIGFKDNIISDANECIEQITITNAVDKDLPENFINTLMKVYTKYEEITKKAFNNDVTLQDSLSAAARTFMNSNPFTWKYGNNKTAEFLARVVDRTLRNFQKLSEVELDKKLDRVMTVFKIVDDKDVFQKFYGRLLAYRLITGSVSSDEAEANMMARLKNFGGYEYVGKLQVMFKDMLLSKSLNVEFKEFIVQNNIPMSMDFNPCILSSGAWPFDAPSESFNVPEELIVGLDYFTSFYIGTQEKGKHHGRKLTWLFSKSRGEITTKQFKKSYVFILSTYQMAILLLFNEKDSYNILQILELTKIDPSFIDQILKPMLNVKLLNEIDQNYSVNPNFSHSRIRINLIQQIKAEVQKENDKTQKSVEIDRTSILHATIVRIMKTAKTLKHFELIAETLKQTGNRFKAEIPMIKKCIDDLIGREYLVRDPEKNDTYNYVA